MTRRFRLAFTAIGVVTTAGIFVTTAVTTAPWAAVSIPRGTPAASSTGASTAPARETQTGASREALKSFSLGGATAASQFGAAAVLGAQAQTPVAGNKVTTTRSQIETASTLSTLKLVNYYPAYHGWSRMWFEWDPATIQTDFNRIAAMGGNGVRLVLQTDVFGYPVPSSTMQGRLASVIGMAANSGLQVQLTLFDNWSSYTDISGSHQWAKSILGPYRADPRIAFVEVKNEMNPADSNAMTWAKNIIPYTRSLASLPVAVSAQGDLNSFHALVQALNASRPDVFSFHFFSSDPTIAAGSMYWAKRIAAPTPIFVGETGMATATGPTDPSDPSMERAQDQFFRAVESATRAQGLPAPAPWTLWDFAPGTLCTCSPGTEYHFGLLRLDGSEKPAYSTIRDFFKYGTIPS